MAAEAGGRCEGYLPIKDYAIVGDCHTAALIARDGSVDWYCPLRFDAPAVFCRLLDAHKGGSLRLAPTGPATATRRYRGPTNVLETTFVAEGGRVRLTDFMAVTRRKPGRKGQDVETSWQLLRLMEGLDGEVELALYFKPTFNFAQAQTRVSLVAGQGVLAEGDGRYLTLGCPCVALAADGEGGFSGRLRLRAGERHWVALTDSPDRAAAERALRPGPCDQQLAATLDYWRSWAARCSYRGPFREQVLRSALALKLLTYEPTGAIVAAPTTSLPELIGGERNWDYRYTWLRDSTRILYALLTIGYDDEANDFFHWLRRTGHADPTALPQTMYTVDGGRDLPERTLDLEGHRCSRPVRVGNAAAGQFQLDIFGEVLIAAHMHYQHRARRRAERGEPPGRRGPTHAGWRLLRALVEAAAERWQEPDNGIWEVRGGRQRFLYSRLMCWAALDSGLRLAQEFGLPAPVARWEQTRATIRHAILTEGFDQRLGAFTQAFGSTALDATALMIPVLGFLCGTNPQMKSTIARLRADLTHNGLVYRYCAPDGLPGGEGTFALCTFWLVDALALSGQQEEAQALFEHVVGYANDVGLLSEEIDPESGELLGNFPQGFSHLALIVSAVNLAKTARHGAEEEPQTQAQRSHHARRAAAEHRSPHGDEERAADEGG